MKRIVRLFIMMCCLATIHIYAQTGADQVVDFHIEKQGHSDSPIYRAPSIPPVQGYYISLTNTLYLSFSYDMGNVNVTIENTETGEFISEYIPTDSGVQSIPVGTYSRLYVITIVRGDGQQYSADLDIQYFGKFYV